MLWADGWAEGEGLGMDVRGEYRFVESLTLLTQRLNVRGGAKSTVMVPRNPAFRQKAPGIRGGVWGEAPRFFIFYFFSCKNHLIQVKDSQ